MTLEISLLTYATAAFLISLWTGNFGYGVAITMIAEVAAYQIFGSGYFIPLEELYPFYFWGTFTWAVAGWALFLALHGRPFFSGRYYTRLANSADKMSSVYKVFGKILLVFGIQLAGHIVYELNVTTFPKWGGAICLGGAFAIAWIVFYFVFRYDWLAMEQSAQTIGQETESVKVVKNRTSLIVRTYTAAVAIPQAVMFLGYIIFQIVDCPHWSEHASLLPDRLLTDGECHWFLTEQWYFGMVMITGGATLLTAIVLNWTLTKKTDRPASVVDARYQPLGLNRY